MESLLYLAHRLPYPPNKGDKVRSYHFLAHLAKRYRVFLGTFIDDPADRGHLAAVRALCAAVHVETLSPLAQRARSATAFLSGEALSLPYFRSASLARWVREQLDREPIGRALAFSSPMAQYLPAAGMLRTVVDFVDMDSAKWAEYAARRRWPARAVFRREASRLRDYERAVAQRVDASLFVTDEERQRFLAEAPECAERVHTVRNGVDGEYFAPDAALASPFPAQERPIVFTGAMDYWPNVDAVVWFAREVLPLLRARDPSVRFYVVGMNPDVAVQALASDAGTVVTGRVRDVRPYLQHAGVVVAPLRVARGIQNKVLEAMAMAKPVVATPPCAGPLGAQPGVELELAADAAGFAERVQALLAQPARAGEMGRLARARVLEHYTWRASLRRLDAVLAPATPAKVAAR